MKVIILCAGNAHRFNGRVKQLLLIGEKETILSRQLKQIKKFGVPDENITIITHQKEISDYALGYNIKSVCPENRETTCDSALSSKHLWGKKTVISLGDVIFSRESIGTVLSLNSPIMFFGDQWERYAISFTDHELAKKALSLGSKRKDEFGKIGHAHRGFVGRPYSKGVSYHALQKDKYFCYLDDKITTDCDSLDKYKAIQKELVKTGLLLTY
jgi:hypothetical protein